MDSHQNANKDARAASNGDMPSLDPLRRVFIPIERRTPNGTLVFRTLDGELYARIDDGSIRRTRKKVKGKVARKLDRVHRRLLRRAAQKESKCL